jgi:hypothetical protein
MSLREALHDEVSKIENYLRGRFDDSVSADLGGLVSDIRNQVDALLAEAVQDGKADAAVLGNAADDLLRTENDESVQTGGDAKSTTAGKTSAKTAAKK